MSEHPLRFRWLLIVFAAIAVLLPSSTVAQWSAESGDRVRNAFGPWTGSKSRICRGACGLGCPSSCSEETVYECLDSGGLRRVRTFECGTHQGCREHDDCLDRCSQQAKKGMNCQTQCHLEAVETYGFEPATSWARGAGPFDREPIVFEYTRDAPNDPEPVFRCPTGTLRACAPDAAGRCVADGGATVLPVFERYPHQPDSIRVSGVRSGRLCKGNEGSTICAQTVDIHVTGEDFCDHAGQWTECTRYGFAFDYENADPSVPLVCKSINRGGRGGGADGSEDFVGGLLSQALQALPEQDGDSEVGALLGNLQEALSEGSSLKDVLSGITIKPHDPGATPADPPPTPQPRPPAVGSPGVPRNIEIEATRGRLVVPMYEIAADPARRPVVLRDIRCSYRGTPVLETTFRLHFAQH